MSISAPFIRRPVATSLLMVAIVLLGAVAFELLPVASLPEVSFPTIEVSAQLPGADPETMASSVATPLEKQFGEIPYLTQMTSTSSLGYTNITLQFALSDNINSAAQLVQTAINAAAGNLPKDMPTPPTYHEVNPADAPILVLGVTSNVLPITSVDDYAESIVEQKALAGAGGRTCQCRRRAAPRDPDAVRSGAARGRRPRSRGCAECAYECERRSAEGQPLRPGTVVHAADQRPDLAARRNGTARSSPIAMAGRSRWAMSGRPSSGRRTSRSRAG